MQKNVLRYLSLSYQKKALMALAQPSIVFFCMKKTTELYPIVFTDDILYSM